MGGKTAFTFICSYNPEPGCYKLMNSIGESPSLRSREGAGGEYEVRNGC
jgi:hypothetical protein